MLKANADQCTNQIPNRQSETGPDPNYFCPAAVTFAALHNVVYKLLYPSKRPLVLRNAPQQSTSRLELTSSESLFNIRLMSLLSVPKMLSARRSDQLLPTEKNKLMHGKWCNLTRAKSIHPERDPEPTNEQRSRPSPSPTIIHLSSVGLRSSASLWLPSFFSNSSERGGGRKRLPRPPPSQLSSCVTPCCTPHTTTPPPIC